MDEETGFSLDFSEFNRGLERAERKVIEAAEDGMWDALAMLREHVDDEPPKAPYLEGNLRGDHTLELGGISRSRSVGGPKHRGGTRPPERLGARNISVRLILHMPYAAKWHEAIGKVINWTQTVAGGGVGPKFVETKLSRHRNRYMEAVARRIRAALGG